MSTPTQESLKQQAKVIRKFLNEKYQVDVSHGHCMELMSQLFGFKDWNTASAALKPKDKQSSLPIHIKTVGEMKKALALFNDDEAILDAELELTVKELRDHLSEIELEEPDPDVVIRQEFSLVLERYVSDIASFKLKLENEDMTWFAG